MDFNTFLIFFLIGLVSMFIVGPIVILAVLYYTDKHQKQSSILRNFPVLGRMRYFLEQTGPEFRQYLFDGDGEGKPFSRTDFQNIVFPAKYLKTVISFGSKRNFEKAGYYIRNAMFPQLTSKMRVDNSFEIKTKGYDIKKETLFSRKEKFNEKEMSPYLLDDRDKIVIGKDTCIHPFELKGQIGMSGMSYGALGENAITALSQGLGIAKGSWMNTGEGGLSKYHLKGDTDIIMQIGPAKFGVRTEDGQFDWEELKNKSKIPQLKAFELKLGQGAKIRGGLLPAEKNTEEIAKTRGVEPHTTVSSPNRFEEFEDHESLFTFIRKIRTVSGKPVGIKIVVGDLEEVVSLVKYMKENNTFPDFITVDGGEGGSGATYQEMADSMGLPIRSALSLLHTTLVHYGVRDKMKIIASGQLFTADRIAIALSMGADLIQIARAYMVTVGCIGAQHCHKNTCPVGVATTDKHLQEALVIEDKQYRVANYTATMRSGLYGLASAAGLSSPVEFSEKNIVFNTAENKVISFKSLQKSIIADIKEIEKEHALCESR